MQNTIFDIVIERQGTLVTKITKNGVVLWPQERHTTGMEALTTQQWNDLLDAQRKDAEAKELHLKEYARQQRANDTMVGGTHYKAPEATGMCPHCRKPIEHWDWSFNLKGLEYAATKYLARWKHRGGLDSLKKVIHYTQKLIEIHFPEVSVTVQYSNAAHSGRLGGGQVDCSQTVAGSKTPYQENLGS